MRPLRGKLGSGGVSGNAKVVGAALATATGGAAGEGAGSVAQSKSEMGYALKAAANGARLTLHTAASDAHWGRCLKELRECRCGFRLNRQLWWEAPTGEHDDYVASLAHCLRAAESLGPERIARGRSGRESAW